LIRQVFIPIDAEAILRIPLRTQEMDWWAWELEKHGEFSVKSAYRKLVAMHEQNTLTAPGGSGDDSWDKVWKLDVPPKVKVFYWRVLHEFLPTKSILNHRHIEPTAFCDMCGAEKETIKHVLTECTMALQFWQEIKLLTGVKLPKLHAHTWATDILRDDLCSGKERSLFTIGMYSLWMQRNKRRHGDSQVPVRNAVKWTVDMANDLWQITQSRQQVHPVLVRPTWQSPPFGWTKCNTDAAFYAGVNQGATGIVLRDSTGNFEGGRACWYPHALDALMMESLACRDGMIFAKAKGVTKLQMETDSQELVRLWRTGDFQRSYLAPILKEIWDISPDFQSFSLMYANRACNRVAHVLAKQATDVFRLGKWQHAPTCILHLLAEDCNPPVT
jgi:ribonuclease HI